MSRSRAGKLAAVVAAVVGVGFAWGRGGAEAGPAQPTDFPDLWQWDLSDPPPPADAFGLRLVLRSRAAAGGLAGVPAAGLRPGEGTDKLLTADVITDDGPDDGRLAVQLIDLRQLGAGGGDGPLRLHGVMRLYGSRQRLTARLAGHSVRGPRVAHAAGWADGERPLLSFATAGADGHTLYTVLLSTRPDGE